MGSTDWTNQVMVKKSGAFVLLVSAFLLITTAGWAAEKEVTIGYQKIYNPWKTAIADRTLETETGYRINWRAFDSGAAVIAAMKEGEVEIALAGSSPIAAGVSSGAAIELFWITEDIAAAEALVVRNGAGIESPQDLRGKRLAVPFVSTAHFHTLFALEQFGINSDHVELLDMPPASIATAWENGTIDAAFIWNPVLGKIGKSGKVLMTSGLLSRWGKATFDGMVTLKEWSAEHGDFMLAFVKTVARADAAYRDNKELWTADSEPVKKITRVVGGNPQDVPGVLALYEFPTLSEQASDRWLGGGKEGGAAQALFYTSTFLKNQNKIDTVLEDYSVAVNPEWVLKALEP